MTVTFAKLSMVDQSNGRRHLEACMNIRRVNTFRYTWKLNSSNYSLLQPKSEGNGPPHVTHSQRRSAFIAAKHIVYRMGSARINFGSWFLYQVAWVAGFFTLRSLLVCFNSMALGTSYEPTDAAHLSVKGQEPSRHSDSSAQFVQFSCLDRLEWSSNQQFTGFGRCDAMGLILEVNLNGLCVDKTLKGGGKGSDLSF